jgi:hypothetical protein
MAPDQVDGEREMERTYWQSRLANPELRSCELLVINKRLRRESRESNSMHSDQEAVLMDS